MFKEKESNFVSFVGYVRNNKNEIPDFIKMCAKYGDENFKKYEIILVDDRSKDGSLSVIKQICKDQNCVVSIVKMSSFQGVDRALTAGTDFAIGDYIYEFENIEIDYTQDMLLNAYKKLQDGFDVVSVCPNKSRTTRNKIFYSIYNTYKLSENKILSTRFRLISRRAVNRIASINMKIVFRKAVFADCGLNNAVLKYRPTHKINSRRHNEQTKATSSALEGMLVFTNTALAVTSTICVLMFAIGFGFAINIIYSACLGLLISDLYVIICFLSFCFATTDIALIFMLNYVTMVVASQLRKKEYLIENIEKVNKN